MTVKTSISRRTVLKSAGAAALAAPLYTKSALASSGEINIMMWSGYMSEDFVSGFETETGIKINYTSTGSNEEMINKMKATKGQGFDLITPTNNRSLQWEPLDVLQPFDMSRVNTAAVNPAMLKVGETAWNFGGKGAHWLPHMWGTEGIAYRADKWLPEGDAPSYGDVWSEENAGKTMGRAHSMMLGAGLYMERIGEMEAGSVWAAYEDEATMRQVWGQITDWCIARKDRIKLIWNDADTQKNGLLNDGVVVGQTWDGPPLALKTAGEPVHYQAPIEGAMAWVDGLVLPAGAKNVDQVYAFIDYAYRKEIAGKEIDFHGYNSPVLGADAYAGDSYKKNFAEAYPGDSLANLNAWPAEAPWYADVRTEFVNKFKSA
ncbi:spermidine/putrescine ABC transporter substrate-binding protein [Leisingera sp. ANG-M1]|uniref:extracellular solute-binding protein n=1 Tax=Leisingera sp. ANG-M1 TaxID=1577895 RepID=UPI00057F8A32|nr:extracellular solute-binding protein [Leisingera sp. ANG-M1]KIC06902.1 spermidine/putrescine ABC transporter substrate-binding protein [Leisingera sp. ANG-M1]